jgi:membrane protein DedA with SNARE-associated domain
MITEWIAHFAVQVLEATGYAGVTLLMALESMVAPVPSEAVMPFVGFLVADGDWGFWPSVLAATLGSLIGSAISYAMGYYGGRPFVLRVGKYLLLNVHDLERTEQFFHEHRGTWAVFFCRFIPVVRHFVSIPAGTGRMPWVPFLVATGTGATIWNTFLMVCGLKLREHWDVVEQYSSHLDIAALVILIAILVRFFYVRRQRAAGDSLPGGEGGA